MTQNTPEPADLVEAVAIKSCPFCDGPARMWHQNKRQPHSAYIECDNALCRTSKSGVGRTKADREANAIAAWNTRPAHNAHMASDGVVQADREAAAKIMISREAEQSARDGKIDRNPIVQAFATPQPDPSDAVIEALEVLYDDGISIDGLLHRGELRTALANSEGR